MSQSDTRTPPAHQEENLGVIGAYRGCIFGMASGAVAAGTLVAVLAIAGSWYDSLFDVVAVSTVFVVVGGVIGAIGGFLLGLARWESQAKWVGSILGTSPLWPFLGFADFGTSLTGFDLAVVAFVLGSIGLAAGLLFEHKFQLE